MAAELPTRSLRFAGGADHEALLVDREWLVTNGLGGYASGTVGGVPTRRFHGYLVAALAAPLGRIMMMNHLAEELRLPGGRVVNLGGYEREDGSLEINVASVLREFRLEGGLPVWSFVMEDEGARFVVERRVLLVHMQNTVYVAYRLVEGAGTLRIKARPSVHFRSHEAPVSGPDAAAYALHAASGRYEIVGPGPFPPLRLRLWGSRAAFTVDDSPLHDVWYRIEANRGYDHQGRLWSPGFFRADLCAGSDVTLVASVEDWTKVDALDPQAAWGAEIARRERLVARAASAHDTVTRELVLAADAFLVTPSSRMVDAARAQAAGDEVRSVIAGYHWFTDWGRDTMISLEGLTLMTGRPQEAGYILRTFAQYVRDGLIPNLFPEGESQGLYHTADATLWFFHAIDRYVRATGDRLTLRQLLPVLRDIVAKHVQGTRFGISVDPKDALLRQGEEGYQLTWMDAKVDGWVVTPRRGKAVEINALWYNALRLLETWLREEEGDEAAGATAELASQVKASFGARFWFEKGGYLYDVVDGPAGDDSSLRPNQIFAISLPHPVLDKALWASVVSVVERELVTPVGLRSLSRHHPDYKPRYDGDLRARDAAYHQGTVWSWLIGPFVDAWLRVHPERASEASRFLAGLEPHLAEACVGSVSEIFDAEPPYAPRGCIAQAWGVAEALRAMTRVRDAVAREAKHRAHGDSQVNASGE